MKNGNLKCPSCHSVLEEKTELDMILQNREHYLHKCKENIYRRVTWASPIGIREGIIVGLANTQQLQFGNVAKYIIATTDREERDPYGFKFDGKETITERREGAFIFKIPKTGEY